MSGDVHVRFRERLEGRFLRATRLIITGASRALLEDEVKPLVAQFLKDRGLVLSEAKTHIVHIDEGFDFLGFNFRKYHGKLRIKPAKTSIAAVKGKIRAILKTGGSLPQETLIRRLNPIIRGWGEYYRHVVSKQVFSDIDHAIWRMTWNWAKRRHPQKGHKWIKDRYFAHRDGRDWVFTDGSGTLFRMTSLSIRRYVKIQGTATPYDPDWAVYFKRRYAQYGKPAPAISHWLSP